MAGLPSGKGRLIGSEAYPEEEEPLPAMCSRRKFLNIPIFIRNDWLITHPIQTASLSNPNSPCWLSENLKWSTSGCYSPVDINRSTRQFNHKEGNHRAVNSLVPRYSGPAIKRLVGRTDWIFSILLLPKTTFFTRLWLCAPSTISSSWGTLYLR